MTKHNFWPEDLSEELAKRGLIPVRMKEQLNFELTVQVKFNLRDQFGYHVHTFDQPVTFSDGDTLRVEYTISR